MKKEEVKRIAETLKRRLAESEEKWDSKIVSHAHIVGYLMGSIEYAIKDLETMSKNIPAGQIVFVLHHTNQGTPESGEIHSIYTTESAALAAMSAELEEGYDGVTMQENEDYDYMYITEQYLKN